MTIAPVDALELDFALLTPAIVDVAGDGPISIQRLGGGRNSRVYRVDGGRGDCYVAKIYHDESRATERGHEQWICFPLASSRSLAHRNRDRRGCEFAALKFLWKNGVANIPEPIATYPDKSFSILRMIDGVPISGKDVRREDVDALVDFHDQLDALRDEPASKALPEASEACFSLDALADNLQGRLANLRHAVSTDEGPARRGLHAFLEESFAPALELTFAAATRGLSRRGLDPSWELPPESRTLSPSDFGLHNALRVADGSLVFVDFEHFGWDDPAKLVSDFLLHPALPISRDLRQYFMIRATQGPSSRAEQSWRVPLVYPIYALKWCTILLNEFVGEHQKRRAHASITSPTQRPYEAVLFEQLAKAHSMLEEATFALENFPHVS